MQTNKSHRRAALVSNKLCNIVFHGYNFIFRSFVMCVACPCPFVSLKGWSLFVDSAAGCCASGWIYQSCSLLQDRLYHKGSTLIE